MYREESKFLPYVFTPLFKAYMWLYQPFVCKKQEEKIS